MRVRAVVPSRLLPAGGTVLAGRPSDAGKGGALGPVSRQLLSENVADVRGTGAHPVALRLRGTVVSRRQKERGDPVLEFLKKVAPRSADHASQERAILGAPFRWRGDWVRPNTLAAAHCKGQDDTPEDVAEDVLASVAVRAVWWCRSVVGVLDGVRAGAAVSVASGRAGRTWRRRPPTPLTRLGRGA